MALIVETGAGLPNANGFISVADADAYFLEVANVAWTGSVPVKEGAIVRATRYMEKRYGYRWAGTIASSDQGLSWPRKNVYDETGTQLLDQVPKAIAQACAEYALIALTRDLIPGFIYPVEDGAPVPFGRITRKLERAGPIVEETYYSSSGANASRVGSGSPIVDADRFVQYPEADLLVAPFLRLNKRVTR